MAENSRSLASIKERLDRDYRSQRDQPLQYDPDAFDSMAVMNSEIWNLGEGGDEEDLSSRDLLPNGPGALNKDALKETFLKAAQNGLLEVIQDLYKFCGPEILNIEDDDCYTPLHRASYNGHTAVAEFMLSHGASVNARTIDGWQPLHCACRWNKVEVASLLLQNGAVINSQTNGGQTPLHLASSNDRAKSTLEMLLSQPDLDADIKNGQDEVALSVAERNGRYSYLFTMLDSSVDYRKFLRDI